jgi:hypothetical protein
MINTTKRLRVLVLLGVLVTAWQGRAAAQTEPIGLFVNVDVGGQAHSHTFATSGSQSVYGETATFSTAQGVSGGFLLDFGAAYQVRPMLSVGFSISTVGDTESATLTASVPHPVFFDSPAVVTGEQNDLSHRETAVHVNAKLTIPTGAWLPENAWLALVIGPSFFNLSQDLISGITVPTGTQSAVANVESQSGSGVGVNVGFEARFPVQDHIGVGGFIRYAGGKVDLDAVQDVKVGGFQAGGGISLAF